MVLDPPAKTRSMKGPVCKQVPDRIQIFGPAGLKRLGAVASKRRISAFKLAGRLTMVRFGMTMVLESELLLIVVGKTRGGSN